MMIHALNAFPASCNAIFVELLLSHYLYFQDYIDNQNPLIPGNDQNRCQIPWMRPQENFFRYDQSTKRCENFPYTGACRSGTQNQAYENVFSSYAECSAASPNLVPGYDTEQHPEITVTQLEGRVPLVPSPDYTYDEVPGYNGIQPPDYGHQGQDYGFDYNNPNIINGQFVTNEDDYGKYVLLVVYT